MKLCLVSAATATDFEDAADAQRIRRKAETPHLGILALAAILERDGQCPAVVSLNRSYYEYLSAGREGVDDFAVWAAGVILATGADTFGFSSICSSYPLTIRVTQWVKQSRPDCTIVLGGPQASVVDMATLNAFPFIDYILRGEAEETLPWLLDELSGSRRLSSVPGLTWRSPFGAVRNANAPVIQDLDALPLPAFHLTGELAGVDTAPLELGRGCPFSCTFCSTNDFFRRKFRLRSPERVLADMRAIASTYGIRSFDLAHDMFTVDRRKVVAFCEHMRDSGEKFIWSCSARTDCVDDELLQLMVESGCRSIFFGVEAGSQRLQRVIEKDLDVGQARRVVSKVEALGIQSTVSLISGFPEETWSDLRDNVDMFVHSLSHRASTPLFNLLAPLAETPIATQYRDQLTLEELCSDMCHQGRSQNELDRELIRKYPAIFPDFYLLPMPNLDREYLLELREFVVLGLEGLRWLMVALHRATSGLLEVFSAWRKHRMRQMPGLRGWNLRYYYMRDESRVAFVRFVVQHFAGVSHPVDCLAEFYLAVAGARAREKETGAIRGELSPAPSGSDIPWRTTHVIVVRFDWDVQDVIDRLRRGETVKIVDRKPRYFRTQSSAESAQVIETSPLIAAGLQACDGKTPVGELVEKLADAFDGPEPDRRLAAECLLETLCGQGLAEIRKPVCGEAVLAAGAATAGIPTSSNAGTYQPVA